MSNTPEPWFAYNGGVFKGDEPFYFDRTQFPWAARLESQWAVIRDELYALVQEHESSLVPYPNREMTSRPNQWKTFGFMFWSIRSRNNIRKCPKTWALIETIPNVLAGSFNLLEPGTTIKPHRGDTNAIIRCHLGIDIPAPAPECAFRVGTETRSWNQGEFLMFCDAHPHTAWNNTNKRRYIFVVDIMREEFTPKTNSVCSGVLAAIYLEIAYQRNPWLRRWIGKRRGKVFLHGLFRTFFRTVLHTRIPVAGLPS